jgi:hypothetical protein
MARSANLPKKPKTVSVRSKRAVRKSSVADVGARKGRVINVKTRISHFLNRRPHRSFRKSSRRDYIRSLELPGYVAFTREVVTLLKGNARTFLLLILTFSMLSATLVGLASQDTYQRLSDTLNETSQNIFSGTLGEVGKAGLLLFTSVSGSLTAENTDIQQVYASIIFMLIWLTTVWLLRAILSGQNPTLRQGMYSAGAPIVGTFLIMIVLLLQLIPAALAIIAYSAALVTNFLSNPLISIVFFFVVFLLILLSVYLLVSTFFALVVVTLPGMYPWKAIRTAGDMVVGRRVRILLRMAWLLGFVVLLWVIVMLPAILFINWIQSTVSQIAWIPIIPGLLVIMSTTTTVIVSTYVYLLYRKVLDDDAAPA